MNRLMATRPLFRQMVQSNVAIAQRTMGHGHKYEDIGPPASFNQLPQPEGDWATEHSKKQSKYNMILGAGALFFFGTLGYVLQSEVLFFNAFPPDTYE